MGTLGKLDRNLKLKPKLVPDLMVIFLDPQRLVFGVYRSKQLFFNPLMPGGNKKLTYT